MFQKYWVPPDYMQILKRSIEDPARFIRIIRHFLYFNCSNGFAFLMVVTIVQKLRLNLGPTMTVVRFLKPGRTNHVKVAVSEVAGAHARGEAFGSYWRS